MKRIFVTRRIPSEGLDLLKEADVRTEVGQSDEEAGLSREALLEGVQRADVLLSLLTERVDREVLETHPGLLGVANCAVGYDNVDVEAATRLGIPVSNTPGVLTDTTADFTWALLLSIARRIPEAHSYTAAGKFRLWGPNLLLGGDVSPGGNGRKKALGVVGFGRIGAAVARRARGFDMEVLVHTRSDPGRLPDEATRVELDELLERSDFVSIHLPLTEETQHRIGAPELRRMKETAYLVNTSRGPVVDEKALVEALREGWIAGAALDVYEHEPRLTPDLAELDNVVLAPHIGSASRDTRNRMATMAAANALHHLSGKKAPNPVNPEVYDSEAWRNRRSRASG